MDPNWLFMYLSFFTKYSVFTWRSRPKLMPLADSHFRPIYFDIFLKVYPSERSAQAWSAIFVSECFLFLLQAYPRLRRRHAEGAKRLIERIQSLSPLNCWVTLQQCRYKLHFSLSKSHCRSSSPSRSLNMKPNRAIHPTVEFIFPIT